MLRQLLLCLGAGALGAAAVLAAGTWLRPAPAIAVVDLQAVMAAGAQSAALRETSEAETRERAARFGERLASTLRALALEYDAVILPRQAVAAGAPDLTPLLARRLGLAAHPEPGP